MENIRKRQRANTNGDSTAPLPPILATEDLSAYIDALHASDNGALLKRMMLQLAISDTHTATYVSQNYVNLLAREQARVIDFDHYSKDVWHKLNSDYEHLSGSKAYDISWDVQSAIVARINKIGSKAGNEHTSFGTKRSGLETLRKIGKTICLSSNDTLGHEVQKQFGHETSLEDAMYTIVEAMSEEQRERMCEVHDGRSTFLEELVELKGLDGSHCVFEGLEGVISLLTGEEEDGWNGETDGDDSEDDDR
ncbi:hypothetical protein CC80DRAFT_489303 [Byssothecium circinans]|uniref:Uncharacterized protein n=1 Tax=Byssothecium circinans TaxID=147558 RepID=A0A6A5UG62_9PLEO|nr:hypothetical protein CC80DRAFT_489303 [Byssothecium circinans]